MLATFSAGKPTDLVRFELPTMLFADLLYQSIWTNRLSCQMVELEVSLFFRVCTVSMLIELILHYTMKYCCKLSFIKIISIKYILTIYKHYQETFCFCFGASETSPTNGSIRE